VNEITTLGIDLAKSVFQLHGIDLAGEVVLRREAIVFVALAIRLHKLRAHYLYLMAVLAKSASPLASCRRSWKRKS
jgi:hypothetical protein